MNKIEKLKKEINAKKAELKKLKKEDKSALRFAAVNPLCDWTDYEKITKFNSVYEFANRMLENKKMEKIDYVYSYEVVMEFLTKDSSSFWKYHHSINNQ